MPQTKSVILRLHLSSVSRIARLASRQNMFAPTEVVGSSMVTATRGLSGAAVARVGSEAATSVLTVRRHSRRCTRELYIGENAVGIGSNLLGSQKVQQFISAEARFLSSERRVRFGMSGLFRGTTARRLTGGGDGGADGNWREPVVAVR